MADYGLAALPSPIRRGLAALNPVFGLADSPITPHLAEDAWRMFTLPGRAMDEGITTEEAVPWAAELAMNAAGASAPFAQAGAAGIFGGKLAKTADQAKLQEAMELAASGVGPRKIHEQTGWFRGADDQWRFEIPDNRARMTGQQGKTVGETFAHNRLFEAYPSLTSIPMRQGSGGRAAYFPPGASGGERITVRNASTATPNDMLHELQHAIQQREGFATGTSSNQQGIYAFRDYPPSTLTDQGKDNARRAAHEAYRIHAGEVEARNVERRADMWDWRRRRSYPPGTEDVPRDQQIVRHGATVQASEPTGIRAYHGSPHDFDRFDMSKIGTGEGAQAYGHGLYFAEAEPVAWSYRFNQAPAYLRNGADSYARQAAHAAESAGLTGNEAKRHALDLLNKRAMELPASGRQPWFDAMNNYETLIGNPKTPGRLYEVNIRARPEDFLDWDKPLSGQSRAVRDAVGGVQNPMYAAWQNSGAFPHVSGQTLYRELAGGLTNRAHAEGRHVGASTALRDAGIPGIRYLDQGSRGAGQGTSNYVLFRDDIVDILKKYGLAGLSIPPAYMAATEGQAQ